MWIKGIARHCDRPVQLDCSLTLLRDEGVSANVIIRLLRDTYVRSRTVLGQVTPLTIHLSSPTRIHTVAPSLCPKFVKHHVSCACRTRGELHLKLLSHATSKPPLTVACPFYHQRSLLVPTSHRDGRYIHSEYNHAPALTIAISSTSRLVFVELEFNVA